MQKSVNVNESYRDHFRRSSDKEIRGGKPETFEKVNNEFLLG